MMLKRFNQGLVGSCLLLCLVMPIDAAMVTEVYPVIIRFSSTADAKEMVQSSYSTLTELNNALKILHKYTVHSLSTGYFFEDQYFQDKKNKVTQALNKQKLSLHVFGKQALNIAFHNPKDNKHYAIRIPVLAFSEFGLDNTSISTIENAKEAQKVISEASTKLQFLLSPQEVSTPKSNEKEVGLNSLKLKNPNSFMAISNSLEQVLVFYRKKLWKLNDYADKVASGKHTEEESKMLNIEYGYLVEELSWLMDIQGQVINPLHIFKGNELTLNLGDNTQKVYYLPEISLSVLQLDNDAIYDFYSAIKSYVDLNVARNWILDWNITGQQEFSPATELDTATYAAPFVIKKH